MEAKNITGLDLRNKFVELLIRNINCQAKTKTKMTSIYQNYGQSKICVIT